MSDREDEVISQLHGLEKKVAIAMLEVLREQEPKPVLEKDMAEAVYQKLRTRCTPEEDAELRRVGLAELNKSN